MVHALNWRTHHWESRWWIVINSCLCSAFGITLRAVETPSKQERNVFLRFRHMNGHIHRYNAAPICSVLVGINVEK